MWFRKIFLAAALLTGGALHAGDYEFNVDMVTGADAEIKLTVPGGQMPRAGFLPVRVRINNRSTSERNWRLELGSGSMAGYGAGAELRSAYSFDVPAASTREFFLFVPVTNASSHRPSQIQGSLDGPQVERSEFGLHLAYGWGLTSTPLAVEPGLETRLTGTLADQTTVRSPGPTMATGAARVRAGRGGASPSPNHQNVSVVDPALWPADWRLWSSFATVLLEHATWERLDAARRRALLDWVAMGGRLVRINSPADTREPHGVGAIVTRTGAMLTVPADIGEFLLNDANRQGEPASRLANNPFWDLTPHNWQLGGRHRWLTGYIIVFGLLIGPVNLFYFAPAGRRHRLFLTVPVLSLGAAVLLFGIITFSDGLGGAGTRRAVVVLQPAQNQAVVFQRQISRTGMLAGRKFTLPADAIMNHDADERQGVSAQQQLWREGDAASGDWFTSRSTQQHSLRRLVPTRERVELVGAPGAAPVVQSTVSGSLRDFIFKDQAGTVWMAAEVPPGTRVTLAMPKSSEASVPHDTFKYIPSHELARGAFYAVGGVGGLIPTLPSIHWRDDLVLYTGQLYSNREAAP